MPIKILEDYDAGYACLYDSETEKPFGFLFSIMSNYDPLEYLKWVNGINVKLLTDDEFRSSVDKWKVEVDERMKQEELEWKEWKLNNKDVSTESKVHPAFKPFKIAKPELDF